MTLPTTRQPADLQPFDRDMLQHFRFHEKLVKLCRMLVAINVDGDLFDKLAPKSLKKLKDNQQIRWRIEDKIRALLQKNREWPR